MSNGFPGFPFGFPAQGFAGRGDENSHVNGKTFLSAGMMDSGFMAGGNIDFIKMAALVRQPQAFQYHSVYMLYMLSTYYIRPPVKRTVSIDLVRPQSQVFRGSQ